MRRLNLSQDNRNELYRRMAFNVVARNQAFRMDQQGTWSLTPAYGVTYSHHSESQWVNAHQMTINGKRDQFTRKELLMVGKKNEVQHPDMLLDRVIDVVSRWRNYAREAGVPEEQLQAIAQTHRLGLRPPVSFMRREPPTPSRDSGLSY